jgi:PAS domain S-box-containing protein
MKITSKISLAFLPILLALAVISLLVYPSLESSMSQSIGSKHLIVLQNLMGQIDWILYKRAADIQLIAREEIFIDYLIGKNRKEHEPSQKIKDLLDISGPWDALTLADKRGTIKLASDERLLGRRLDQNPEEALALRQALKGSVYSSDLVVSRQTGRSTIIFAAPILGYAPDHAIQGAVIGHFSWPVILEFIEETRGISDCRLYNKTGLLIGTNSPQERAGILRRNDHARPDIRRALAGERGSLILQRPEDGGRNLAVYAPQPGYLGYKGNGWVITAQTPTETAFAPIRTFLRNSIGVFSLFICFSFLITFLIIVSAVSKPLSLLTKATHQISQGRYGAMIPITTKDELGELTQSFNRMSEALSENIQTRNYFDNVLQSMVDFMIATDSAGNIKTVNRAALKLSGYSEAELLDQPVILLFGQQKTDVFWNALWEALTHNNDIKDTETVLRTKMGAEVPILISGSVLHSEGAPKGFVIVGKNLAERKRFESMLLQSEKLSAVGQLAAGVAHEINNPLGIILGFAQSAAKRIQASDGLSLPLKSIEREALRCKNLVQNLLTFSRQSKGTIEEVDLNETVTNTLNIIEAQARVKSIEVSLELGPPETFVGDKNQLQQVLINLCNNAIDAMPNGGKLVVRTKKSEREGGSWAVIEVEDNGSGIPQEIQDKIFNPFFTTKEVGKGTGLGLSLVYEIIQRHKGTIEVTSAPGKGTTFSIVLPTKDSAAGAKIAA